MGIKENSENEKIRKSVDEFYRKISKDECRTEVSPEKVSESLGYSREMMAQLPKGVDLGLSCGNPLENFELGNGETLVDLGSGTGKDIFLTRMKYPDSGTLYGMDRVVEMIAKAEKTRDMKKFKNIEFRQGTLTAMPFDSESMDKAISNCVINLEPEKQDVYNELYRILKKGGKFYISDIMLKKELPEEWKKSEKMHNTWVGGALLEEELEKIIEKAGFKNILIIKDEVTDAYAEKWGYGLKIKEYIQRGMIMGEK